MGKRQVPILGLQAVLDFGKHQGKTVEDVLESEPTYIDWAVSQRIFVLDEEADEMLCECLAGHEEDLYEELKRRTNGQ